ncbi:MAG TPA: Gfo/Idh/MocA family oxidoreductase [Microlunatus sp.]|nr:Gfo/Idh/MocA family oxidoreductase [Microlunatus sp.]
MTEPPSWTMINTARAIATRAHRGQTDKIGRPYIRHPETVAELVRYLPAYEALEPAERADAVAAAWLHDVIEDTDQTAESLAASGISDGAVAAALALTRHDEVADADYYATIDRSPVARAIKIADLASNLDPARTAGLDHATRDRLDAKYAGAMSALSVDPVVIEALHAAARADHPVTPVRLGVIGFGLRGQLARSAHAPHRGSVITAICDPSPRGRADARQTFPADVLITDDLDTLLASDLDAVLLLTPDHLHEPMAIELLGAGVAVFCEKPLAVTVEGCDAVLRAAFQSGSKLYVGHNMRHMPVVTTLRGLIAAGRIGEVQGVWCRHFVGHGGDFYFKDWHADRRNSTGLLLQKGAHDIDVIHDLAGGESVSVSAVGALRVYGDGARRREREDSRLSDWFDETGWPPRELQDLNPVVDVEDISMMIMKLDNGVLASYQQCHFTPDYWRNYTVIGDAGRLENFGDGPGGRIGLWNRRHRGWSEPDEVFPIPDGDGGHAGADPAMIAEFVEFVRSGTATTTTPLSARQAVATAVAATESLRGDGSSRGIPPVDPELTAYFAGGQRRG